MDPAHHASAGHESSHAPHEGQTLANEATTGNTWSFDNVDGPGPSSPPHVSLFSPGVPAPQSPTSPGPTVGSSRPHVGSVRSLSSSRSMPSLANIATMSKRAARLKVSDEHPLPIVQLQTRIDQAQKSADDPTTPLENETGRRTTMDLMRSEHAVRTDISRLFSESVAGAGSRAPSYNNATGPLYLRGTPSVSTSICHD